MASIALSVLQPLTILQTDTQDIVVLKNNYNAALTNAQTLLPDINTQVTKAQQSIDQLNQQLSILNEVAQGINKCQAVQIDASGNIMTVTNTVGQVPGTQTISTISISVSGSVMVV